MVSEEKIVEIVDTQRRRRTTDIQGITKARPEHSSGELKIEKMRRLLALSIESQTWPASFHHDFM